MSGKIKEWGLNLALLSGAILLTLGGFELGLRLFLPQKTYRFPRGLFRNEPDRVYGLTPGFRGEMHNPEYRTRIRINSLGFRGEELKPKQPGATRLLVIGDSFVSAFNVEENETFVSVLREGLQRDARGGMVEVINAGTPGYGTWHELQVLRDLRGAVQPDLLVLCVYLGNDHDDNLAPRDEVIRDGLVVERDSVRGILPIPVRSWLQRNSMTYVFLWNSWSQIRPLFGRARFDPLLYFKDIVARKSAPRVEEAYRVTRDILIQMTALARQNHLPILMVMIPEELQVYPERFHQRLRAEELDSSDFDLELPNRRWSEMARGLDLPVLDLLPIFRSHTRGPHLYMSLDGHLSVLGNRIAGEAIRDAVRPLLASYEAGQ
jgi:hypothetical protein